MSLLEDDLTPQRAANGTLARLDPLVGVWATRGLVRGAGEAPPVTFEATDTYEWMAGGFFLLHHVEAQIGGQDVRVLEIFGYDETRAVFWARSHDNTGRVDDFDVHMDGRQWELVAQSERFRGEVSEDGAVMSGLWERRDGDDWIAWMDVTLKKVL